VGLTRPGSIKDYLMAMLGLKVSSCVCWRMKKRK
jgi:hypothetical protein